MRPVLWLFCLSVLVAPVLAWTQEDYEIFDLVSAVEASEGKGTTFYSWLGVSPSATSQEISRAYRKKSIQVHPDKNPGRKNAHERFARLGTIAEILRDKGKRERYDFFYKNGVPRWRGTGYYYSRYRPGIGFVLVFLIVITTAVQYVIQRINYKNDLARIDRFVREARIAAWGPKMVRVEGKRKVRVNLGGRPYLDEDGNVVQGKQIDMVVEGDDVFILEPDGSLLPLDDGAASPPSLNRTWLVVLVRSCLSRKKQEPTENIGNENDDGEDEKRQTPVGNRKQRKAARKAKKQVEADDLEESSSSEILSSGAATPVGSTSKLTTRGPTVKAGGQRRKGAPRKVPDRKLKKQDEPVDSTSL